VHCAQDGLEHVSLSLPGPVRAGRPAVLADPDRHRRRDADAGQVAFPVGAEHPVDRAGQLVQPEAGPEHVRVHVDARVVEGGGEVAAAEIADRGPEPAGRGVDLGRDRETDRRRGSAFPLGGGRPEHAGDQCLAHPWVGAVGRGGYSGQVGLSGDLYRRELVPVTGHHLGHEGHPLRHRPGGVPVTKDQVPRQPRELRDLAQHRLGAPRPGPAHVHPRHNRRPVALQLGRGRRDLLKVIGRPGRHAIRRSGQAQRKYSERQGLHHPATLTRRRLAGGQTATRPAGPERIK